MTNIPPILIVTGSQHVLRRRFIRKICNQKSEGGWRVEQISGENRRSVVGALAMGGFFSERSLVVMSKPEKAPLEMLQLYAKTEDPETVLLLDFDGDPKKNTKFGKWVATVRETKSFPAPQKEWDKAPAAISFALAEVQANGFTLDTKLAGALVARVGSDFGVVAFELQKMMKLAKGRGQTTIDKACIVDAISELSTATLDPVLKALEARNVRVLLIIFDRVQRTNKNDVTIPTCRRIAAKAYQWLQATHLDEEGLSPKEAADLLGKNAWFYETKLLPEARRWKEAEVVRLIRALALSERAVLRGHLNPWMGLSARLAEVCAPGG